MMELFSLGADRGAYSEDDIREQARALTGWRYDWSGELGAYNFRFDPKRHDASNKTVFGQTGNWNWEDACRLCVENPLHPSFFVDKLWSYFVAAAAVGGGSQDALISTYRGSGWQIRPVLETILMSPDLYEGPPMVKPPVVQLAGMLRALGRYIDTDAWTWLCEPAGQVLFWPPERLRLGRHPLARHLADAGPLEHRRLRPRRDLRRRLERQLQRHRDRRRSAGAGGRLLGLAGAAAPSTGPSCSTSPSGPRTLVDRQLAARPLPGDAPERPAAADRHQPGPILQ